MIVYPAIDLRGGRCVRLAQGDYERETVYGDDPVAVASAFVEAGATWIHVVDLDAARGDGPVNRSAIAAIAAAVGVPVQTGGGVRTLDDAKALADAGVARVVMGTAAVREPALVESVAPVVPVAVGLDHRAGIVAVQGWTESTGLTIAVALERFAAASAFVVTEIGRDGMLTGPDLEGLAVVLQATSTPVIASGGVAGTADVVALRDLCIERRSLAGVIVGRAIYEARLDVASAIAAATTAEEGR